MVEKWVKNQVYIEIFVCKFESFSEISNLNWFLAQTQTFAVGFLISLRIMKSFKKSQNFLKKFQKIINFHWFFNIFWRFSSLKKRWIFYFSNVKSTHPIAPRTRPPSAKSCINYWIGIIIINPFIQDTSQGSRRWNYNFIYYIFLEWFLILI